MIQDSYKGNHPSNDTEHWVRGDPGHSNLTQNTETEEIRSNLQYCNTAAMVVGAMISLDNTVVEIRCLGPNYKTFLSM